MLKAALRMTSNNSMLARLESNANQADQIILALKAQLSQVRQSKLAEAMRQQQEKLTSENTSLRKEVTSLKEQLVREEIKNGVKQVGLSSVQPSGPPSLHGRPVVFDGPVASTVELSFPNGNDTKVGQQADKKEKAKKEGKKKTSEKKPPEDLPIDISRLDLRIGRIVDAKYHPDADSLYVEEVDVGEGTNRTILSGLVKHIPLEQMQNRLAVFLCNLKPAKMRGIMSQGMIMCGSTPEKVEIVDPPEGVVPGEKIVFDGHPGEPDTLLNPKKKVWEQLMPDLKIDDSGVATFKGVPFKVEGKGICKVNTLRSVIIK